MKIKFKPDIKTLFIDDDAKTLKYFWVVFIILQLINAIFQLFNYWGQLYNPLLYIFIFIFVIFIAALVYYLLYDSSLEVLKHDEICYYKEKSIIGIKFRYIKLKNAKVRLLNFKKNSDEIKVLKQYFNEHKLTVKP